MNEVKVSICLYHCSGNLRTELFCLYVFYPCCLWRDIGILLFLKIKRRNLYHMDTHAEVLRYNYLASTTDLEQNCIINEPKKPHKINLHVPFSTPDLFYY